MGDRTEAMIEAAMDALFGDRFEAADCAQDDDTRDLVQRHLELEAKITDFRNQVASLMTRHNGDERFKAKCRAAFQARAELIALEQQTLLDDWWPGLRHAGRPM